VPLSAPCGECFDPWIPDSNLPPIPKNSINSLIRKILLATPEFPRFYADFILALAPNSHEAKILRPHYQKILAKVNSMSNEHSCTHIKVTGVRCNSPALRGEQFCYFHQNAHRGVRRPKQSRLHPIALIEDEESIQYALMEVINALMRNTIDMKRATLIIRALHIAVKNAARVKYNVHSRDMVTEIPEYAVPPVDLDGAETSEADLPYSAFLPPQSEHQIAEQRRRANKAQEWRDQQAAIRANLERAAQTVAGGGTRGVRTEGLETGVSVGTSVDVGTGGLNVGTGASARPASKASVPSAAATTTAVQRPAAAIPPHDFKTPNSAAPPARLPQPSRLSKAENLDSSASDRKPPEAVKPAPKERKITAPAARRG
jgi:hypothetical protein